VTSGTATLETACFETPMIVVYRTSWLTYLIARALVRVKNIGLVNIVAGKTIVPELIQYNVTVQKIVELASGLLKNEAQRMAMKKTFPRERFARLKRSVGKCCRCNPRNESGVMETALVDGKAYSQCSREKCFMAGGMAVMYYASGKKI